MIVYLSISHLPQLLLLQPHGGELGLGVSQPFALDFCGASRTRGI
jgi:hypothetical protein